MGWGRGAGRTRTLNRPRTAAATWPLDRVPSVNHQPFISIARCSRCTGPLAGAAEVTHSPAAHRYSGASWGKRQRASKKERSTRASRTGGRRRAEAYDSSPISIVIVIPFSNLSSLRSLFQVQTCLLHTHLLPPSLILIACLQQLPLPPPPPAP